uniref:Uncharacterized protein n=1 Tax=Meloidogyne enterolobii TaxID=390850 RepID=A0A6V7U6W9_MELEN|nr:unnamed protein product [Meloidogyne enterolobii]
MMLKYNLLVIFFLCVLAEIYSGKPKNILEGKEEETNKNKNVPEELPISTMNDWGRIEMGESSSSSSNNLFNINSISKSVCGFVGNFKEKIKIKCQNILEKKLLPIKYLKGAMFCILIVTAPCPVENNLFKTITKEHDTIWNVTKFVTI